MKESFPAPTHLRGRAEATERLLDTYRKALSRFERPVLERAWQKVAQEHRFWNWPMPAEIVKAAEHFERLARPSDGWVEQATELTDAYVRRFMKASAVAAKAREGGYEREMKAYVREAAWVQAQYISGRKDVSFTSGVLFPQRPREKEAEDEFFQRAKAQAEKGCVQVRVPAELTERWREGAARGRGR